MTEAKPKADRDRKRIERVLQILNSEPTEATLSQRLEEATGDKKLSRLGSALFAHRSAIGSFQEIGDLEGVEEITGNTISALIDALNPPTLDFETETLEFVHWTHGSELVIDEPDHFGSIERRKEGIRISSLRLGDPPRPALPGRSWAHMSVSVPAYVHQDKQFYVKSVLFNFYSSAPFGIMGQPIATPYDIEVWDGHLRIATERLTYLPNSWNRYLRVPVESSQKVRYGLRVSFLLFVVAVSELAEFNFWIDIGAVGVELVTRTGLVLTPTSMG